ncbi:MAG: hypothetical protein A2Y10_19630 [Planctomycetes bacterium GWF2_41_51]|nr:MAG: hypothetical protein A2Y10_19630 [Planctomycetes bacterium GWF2_41_51]HBG28191.1 hypothetical protein [Phycisphaerales bacterium]
MKRWILVVTLVLAAVVLADTIEERRVALQARINELPAKKAALKTKTYSGTFDAILTERIADLNEVAAESSNIVKDVNALGTDTGIPDPPIKEVVDKVCETVDCNDIKKKEQNNQFVKTINEIATDPNITDPNEIAQLQELNEWVFEVFTTEPELGGL